MKRSYLFAIPFLLLGLSSIPAQAGLITGGTIQFLGMGHQSMDIFGEYWEFRSELFTREQFFIRCSPCNTGKASVGGALSGGDIGLHEFYLDGFRIPAYFNGILFPKTFLIVRGPDITFSSPGTWTGPFTFEGQLCGRINIQTPGACPLFYPDLKGSGTVTLVLEPYLDIGVYRMVSATYVFDPIPEPSSMWLVGSVVPALLYWRSKRA